jgi:hypothetical protein
MNSRKVRVMVIERSVLERYFLPTCDPKVLEGLGLDEPSHRMRIETLKMMGRLYTSKQPTEQRMLGVVELGVMMEAPAGASDVAVTSTTIANIAPSSNTP